MDSYDLFSAMSGANESLVARSDYRVKYRKQGFVFLLTTAACLAIVMISIIMPTPKTAPEVLSTQPPISTYETDPLGSEPIDIIHNEPLKLNGGDVGTLNIIQLSYVKETVSMPEFLMNIDDENFYLADDGENFYIYQRIRAENKPACWLTLAWQPKITPDEAAQQQLSNLSTSMESVTESPTDLLQNGLLICGSNGSEWDSAQTEVYITSDYQGGVFIFTLEYYLADTDGCAIQLRDMIQTFEIITVNATAPAWMTELKNSVDSFTTAFLKNDFSDVHNLITEDADIYTYDEDVLTGTQVLKTHYTLDDTSNPSSAQVSVRHKYLENDAYDYITMELTYVDGRWQIEWAMLER